MRFPKTFVEDIPRRKFLELGLKGGLALTATPQLLTQLLAGQGTSASPVKVGADSSLLNRTISKALEKGGDFAEVYIEKRISRTILMEESKFKSAVFGISQGAGVRVIAGEKTGYAYTDEIADDKLLRAAEVASTIARGSRASKPVDIRPARRKSFITIKLPLGEVAEAKRLDIIRRAHQAALDYDARIKMASINYYEEVRGRTIANSEGVLLSDELPLLFFVVQTLSVGNNTQHLGRERLSRHSGFEMFEEVTPEQVARACARESIAMLEAKDAPAGKLDVVMQNGWGGVLVHEAVGHPLEADNIAKKIGVFTGKLGQKVANPVFTMVDDGGHPQLPGTESFRNIPIPRMTNTFIDNGKERPEDILASTKSGLYVQSLSGGSVNPITGVFNFTCREAYLIENGKKTSPVKGATLIGNCLDIISNIDAVGNDLDFGPGICGKGQSAEVSAGQPTVRIRGINVGGTRAAR
ncbi:MAG: TldD/PmbA family protein [Candidatus Aminicenantes bacterium]|nr:TldD/PmbA family protein [Candidatus Aminicenantes bacterium]